MQQKRHLLHMPLAASFHGPLAQTYPNFYPDQVFINWKMSQTSLEDNQFLE